MKTRVRIWKRYRDKIASSNFKDSGTTHIEEMEQGDIDEMSKLARSSEAIAMAGDKEKELTPYDRYIKNKRIHLIIKIAVLVLAIVLMALLYFFWVK